MATMTSDYGSGIGQARGTYRSETDGTSDYVEVPNTGRDTLVMVAPNEGSTARIEYTISTVRNINEDKAIWFAWDFGDVTENTIGAVSAGVTAVRQVSTGLSKWEVAA